MIQCIESATPAVIVFREFPVSLQEAVLGLKTRTPITVLLERGDGFFRQLQVKSFPHFGKEHIKRRKTGASNIQADADRCKQTQMDRQTVSLVDIGVWKKGKEWRTFLSRRSPTIDAIGLNLIVLYLHVKQGYRRYNLTKWYLQIELCS